MSLLADLRGHASVWCLTSNVVNQGEATRWYGHEVRTYRSDPIKGDPTTSTESISVARINKIFPSLDLNHNRTCFNRKGCPYRDEFRKRMFVIAPKYVGHAISI